jgi:hypothetical protein
MTQLGFSQAFFSSHRGSVGVSELVRITLTRGLVLGTIVLLAATSTVAVGVFLGGQISSSSTSTSTSASQSFCNISFPTGLQLQATNGTGTWTAFVMSPDSTAKLCVTWSTNSQDLKLSDFSAEIDNVTVTPYADGNGYSYSRAPNVNITWNASSVHYSKINESSYAVTVIYTITATSNAHGFYTLGYPNNCPPIIPFAVVGNSQSVSSSDFPKGFFFLSSCKLSGLLSTGRITGYDGVSTTVVNG